MTGGFYLEDKFCVDVGLCGGDVEIGRLDEAEEEFVDDLQMRPCGFHHRLILFGIKDIANGIRRRRDRSE